MKGNNLSLSFKVLVTTLFLVPLVIFATLIVANADPKNENESVIATTVDNVIKNITTPKAAPAVEGIYIFQSDGTTPAVPDTDYVLGTAEDENLITLKTTDLKVVGANKSDKLNWRFICSGACQSVTFKDIYLKYSANHHTFRADAPSPEQLVSNDYNFTLNIEGEVYFGNTNTDGSANCGIQFYGGDPNKDFLITGTSGSFLGCYSEIHDAMSIQKAPLTIGGNLEAFFYTFVPSADYTGGDAIDWGDDASAAKKDILTLKDNAILECGSDLPADQAALFVGDLNVLGSSSLYAYSLNKDTKDNAPVTINRNCLINTTGDVVIDAYDDSSWQACICKGDMHVQKCSRFYIIAQDFSALDVYGILQIDGGANGVYISGGYGKDAGGNYAQRGALVVNSDKSKLLLPEGSIFYGSTSKLADPENVTSRTISVFTGENKDHYTNTFAIYDGEWISDVAKTLILKPGEVHDLVLVPGQKATYATPGYKDCYKDTDTNTYYEDPLGTTPISNYEVWKTSGNGYIAPLKNTFEPYRQQVKANCDALLQNGDTEDAQAIIDKAKDASQEAQALVDKAKADIDAYVYDDGVSLAANEGVLDGIYNQLVEDIHNIIPTPTPTPTPTPGGGGTLNPAAYGGVQTGDNIAMAIGLILALAACTSVIVLVRRKYN